jgi:hypothetical protein
VSLKVLVSGGGKDIGDLLQEIKDLAELVKTPMKVSRTENYTEDNLMIDGQRLSRVSTKHMDNYAYGGY